MPKTNVDIDRKAASQLLGVTVRTIDRYIRRGRLFAREEQGRIWLDRREVMQLAHNDQEGHKKPIDIRLASRRQGLNDNNFYKDMYEEAKNALRDYHLKLEQANYRIGQLESQALHSPIPKLADRRDDFFSVELLRKEIHDREREIIALKEIMKKEKASRVALTVLVYILLAMLPLAWYLLKG